MKRIFADTYYWIAILSDRDQGHLAAQAMSESLQHDLIVTTHEVLSEVLTHFSGYGRTMRQSAATFVRRILADQTIVVHPQSDQSFRRGFDLYESRPDKEYSLTDCISMEVMRQEGITEILTHDKHFTQEGFVVLL